MLGEEIVGAERFPTGLHHWVYEVSTESGRTAVVRIATRENRAHLAGAVYWQDRLLPLDVPLAPLLHAELDMERFDFPFLVLERLPGTDLGHVYAELDPGQREVLAHRVAGLQVRAARLPDGRGFGYALDESGRGLLDDWPKLLRAVLRRTAKWLEGAPAEDLAWHERVEAELARLEPRLARVPPGAFFHDTTTKNVIVWRGELSGIVDVDSMAYGDDLLTLALTRMSLLWSGHEPDYVEAWWRASGRPEADRPLLDAYTAMHGVSFLGELRQAFNRDAAPAPDTSRRQHLHEILSGLLAG